VERLKPLIVSPNVSVSLTETHSQPFTVLGSVKTPGVYQLTGRKTLLDALSQCGGPTDDAGYTLRISRRKQSGPLPLPGAMPDPTGEFSIAEVSLQNILDSSNPSGNILLMPDDVISVPRDKWFYVIGDATGFCSFWFARVASARGKW
jgi:protein involved in polysaccharide export with SLBB domain